jgi:DHHC palmitoyltransferase
LRYNLRDNVLWSDSPISFLLLSNSASQLLSTLHCKPALDRISNRCISRMDHFCPWMNNAIGAKNQKNFLLFLIYTDIVSAYMYVVVAWHMVSSTYMGTFANIVSCMDFRSAFQRFHSVFFQIFCRLIALSQTRLVFHTEASLFSSLVC